MVVSSRFCPENVQTLHSNCRPGENPSWSKQFSSHPTLATFSQVFLGGFQYRKCPPSHCSGLLRFSTRSVWSNSNLFRPCVHAHISHLWGFPLVPNFTQKIHSKVDNLRCAVKKILVRTTMREICWADYFL